jgi:carbonic anhydrase
MVCGETCRIHPVRKIFHFDSPADPYVADAAVLCCFDHRISTAVRKFLRKQGIERCDMIIVAGGAKTLASPRNDFEQDFILEQVRLSIRLHQTRRALVMSHSDCATYGGLANFKGDRAAEAEHHRGELHRAAELLVAKFPDISVEPYFVKFDGVWEVQPRGRSIAEASELRTVGQGVR